MADRLTVEQLLDIARKDPRVHVTSGYRTPEHNAAVGGVPNSQHPDGTALDFVAPGMSLKEAQAMFPGEKVMYHNAGSGFHFHVQGAAGMSSPDQAFEDVATHPRAGGDPDHEFERTAGPGKAPFAKGQDPFSFVAAQTAVPAGDEITKGVNALITQGVAKGRKPSDIKADVATYQAQHGLDPTSTTGVDEWIAYKQRGGKGAAPVLTLNPVKPLNTAQRVLAGVQQGARDVAATVDPLAKYLDNKIGNVGGMIGLPSADKVAEDHRAARALFENTAGTTTSGNLGRIGGDVIASAPVLAAGGGLVSAFSSALPIAAPATAGALEFLGGSAGGNLLVRGASTATHGALQGAAGAAVVSGGNDAPLIDQLATGALAGGVLAPVAGKVASVVGSKIGAPIKAIASGALNTLQRAMGATNYEAVAGKRIGQRVLQDVNAGGLSPTEIIAAGTTSKPLTLMDIGGENIRGLAGRVARSPGESRGIIAKALNERDNGAGERISADIQSAISGGGSSYDTTQSLMRQRAQDASPLYQKAFEGGSIAPLETQFESVFQGSSKAVADAQKRVAAANNADTFAKAAVSKAGNNVYSSSAALRQQAGVAAESKAAQAELEAAQSTHEANLDRLRRAQADGSANAPGAVWSPRIQQFLDDPVAKAGLAKGIEVQRLESLAEGKPFNPTEYGITGYDAAGNPIVTSVPNMRTLDAVKKGFDAILSEYPKSPAGKIQLDQRGRAIEGVRKSFLKELDALNPDYATARAAYSGPSSSMDAMARGRTILNQRPEANRDYIASLSEGDREFFKQGAADALLEKIARTSAGGDETKRIIGNDYVRDQIRPLFSSEAKFKGFLANIESEAKMFATRQAVLGNSATAARLAEDSSPGSQAAVSGLKAAGSVASGHVVGAVKHGWEAISNLAQRREPETNAAMAKLLASPLSEDSDVVNLLQRLSGGNPPLNGNSAARGWLARNHLPLVVAGGNRLLQGGAPNPH